MHAWLQSANRSRPTRLTSERVGLSVGRSVECAGDAWRDVHGDVTYIVFRNTENCICWPCDLHMHIFKGAALARPGPDLRLRRGTGRTSY